MHSIANDDACGYAPVALPLPRGFSGGVGYAINCMYPLNRTYVFLLSNSYCLHLYNISSVAICSVDRIRVSTVGYEAILLRGYDEGLAGCHALGWHSFVYIAS
jgi:hypothetical protein